MPAEPRASSEPARLQEQLKLAREAATLCLYYHHCILLLREEREEYGPMPEDDPTEDRWIIKNHCPSAYLWIVQHELRGFLKSLKAFDNAMDKEIRELFEKAHRPGFVRVFSFPSQSYHGGLYEVVREVWWNIGIAIETRLNPEFAHPVLDPDFTAGVEAETLRLADVNLITDDLLGDIEDALCSRGDLAWWSISDAFRDKARFPLGPEDQDFGLLPEALTAEYKWACDHLADVADKAEATNDGAGGQISGQRENVRKRLPRNMADIAPLIAKIKGNRDPDKTREEIALELTGGDEKRAKALLRQLQPSRHGYLLD